MTTHRSKALPAAVHAIFGAVLLGACASAEPPRAELSAAETAIAAAERSGAAERAPVELNAAREKLMRARAAVQQQDHMRAERLAREAAADAELADTRAQEIAAQTALREVRQSLTILQGEIGAQSPPAAPGTLPSAPGGPAASPVR